MPLDADTLLDRMRLKRQASQWRTLAIVLLCLIAILALGRNSDWSPIQEEHIAHITIDGLIVDDPEQWELLTSLQEDRKVRAVLVALDTPGGTAVGGEEMYLRLRRLASEKPVVILMRTLCTSAGYMAALGGDYILAREGTITGSIGVIMESAELTGMAEKLGITPITVKSGPNKAAPNLLEPFTPEQRDVIESVVDDFYAFFVGLVAERRGIDRQTLSQLADGRILTGGQALEAKLIDGLGGEPEARAWLKERHNISDAVEIRYVKPESEEEIWLGSLGRRLQQAIFSLKNLNLPLDGLVSIWQPAAH